MVEVAKGIKVVWAIGMTQEGEPFPVIAAAPDGGLCVFNHKPEAQDFARVLLDSQAFEGDVAELLVFPVMIGTSEITMKDGVVVRKRGAGIPDEEPPAPGED